MVDMSSRKQCITFLFCWGLYFYPELALERDPDTEFEGVPSSLAPALRYLTNGRRLVQVERRVLDEEGLLDAIPRNSQEAIVSCLSLHWANDLPGILVCGVDCRN
jgi:hypothetical protein